MIFLLRKITKNFLLTNKEYSLNGLPLESAPVVEDVNGAETLDGYIKNILLKMNEDA